MSASKNNLNASNSQLNIQQRTSSLQHSNSTSPQGHNSTNTSPQNANMHVGSLQRTPTLNTGNGNKMDGGELFDPYKSFQRRLSKRNSIKAYPKVPIVYSNMSGNPGNAGSIGGGMMSSNSGYYNNFAGNIQQQQQQQPQQVMGYYTGSQGYAYPQYQQYTQVPQYQQPTQIIYPDVSKLNISSPQQHGYIQNPQPIQQMQNSSSVNTARPAQMQSGIMSSSSGTTGGSQYGSSIRQTVPQQQQQPQPQLPPLQIPPQPPSVKTINTEAATQDRPKPFPRPPLLSRSGSPSSSPVTQRYYVSPTTIKPPTPPSKALTINKAPYATPSEVVGLQRRETRFSSYSSLGNSSFGLSGLKNLGNTCFLNSIVQCLNSTTLLTRFFTTGSYRVHLSVDNPMGSKGVITSSYASLISDILREQTPVYVPVRFKEMVESKQPMFRGNEQHDSSEFLAFLLDAMHEDLNVRWRNKRMVKNGESDEDERMPDEVLLFLWAFNYVVRWRLRRHGKSIRIRIGVL
jgi:hypothetical protein